MESNLVCTVCMAACSNLPKKTAISDGRAWVSHSLQQEPAGENKRPGQIPEGNFNSSFQCAQHPWVTRAPSRDLGMSDSGPSRTPKHYLLRFCLLSWGVMELLQ